MSEIKKTINTRIVLRNDDLANWEGSTKPLLKGEVALAKRDDGLYEVRVGDGEKKWSELSATGFGHTKFYEKSTFNELSDVTNAPNGSIGIVTETIADGKVSKTAYTYNDLEKRWEALDGNYSAENVFFKNDITLAGNYTQVGNITKTSTETKTLDAAGKSVKDIMSSIFTKELDPSVSHPYWDFSATGLTGEVGLTYNVPGATLKLTNVGSYTYGPDTGVTIPANNAVIKRTTAGFVAELSNSTALTAANATYSLPADTANVTYTNSTVTYNYTAEAHHPQGAMPVTNTGSERPALRIAADDWSGHGTAAKRSTTQTATASFTGYYPCYYGQFASQVIANPEAITSADIVSYAGGAVTAVNGFQKTVNTNQRPADPSGYTTYTCQQWFWIAKKGVITSVYARQSSPAAPAGTVMKKATTVVLPTANGFGDTEYDVWYINNDNPASNGYRWKLNGTF